MTRQTPPPEADVRRAVQELILAVLNRKKVAATLDDIREGVPLMTGLGIDSLDILQLCFSVEKRYKLRFSEDEIKAMGDLGAIVRTVNKHLAAP